MILTYINVIGPILFLYDRADSSASIIPDVIGDIQVRIFADWAGMHIKGIVEKWS